MAVPKINPNPKDAPIIPNPFARYLGSVVSEIIADATGMFPAVMPSSARAMNKKIAFGAKAIIRKERAVPVIEIIKRGFRPYISDKRPITGVDKNWHTENKANNSPFWKSDKPNFIEYEYKIGIIIPYPKALTIAIRAIIIKFLLFLNIL
jgi:hypothetical protein